MVNRFPASVPALAPSPEHGRLDRQASDLAHPGRFHRVNRPAHHEALLGADAHPNTRPGYHKPEHDRLAAFCVGSPPRGGRQIRMGPTPPFRGRGGGGGRERARRDLLLPSSSRWGLGQLYACLVDVYLPRKPHLLLLLLLLPSPDERGFVTRTGKGSCTDQCN